MKLKTPNFLTMATLLCVLLFSSCQKDATLLPQDKTTIGNGSDLKLEGIKIPLAGNAFITEPVANGKEAITPTGLTNWTNPNAITSTYFRLGQTGDLYITVLASVPKGVSTIKLIVNGKSFTIAGMTGAAYKQYRFVATNIDKAGYVKVDLQGISNSAGSVFANVSDLEIYGSATTANVSFANDASHFDDARKGAGVSLYYNTPSNTEWFYNEVSIPISASKAGIDFISTGFNEGKAGLQITSSNEKRIMFSVSNSTGDNAVLVNKGANVIEENNADGKTLSLTYNWQSNVNYKFLTNAKLVDGKMVYSTWFYSPDENDWKFIASCSKTTGNNGLKGLYSSMQGSSAINGYYARSVRYYNQWTNTNGTWSEVTSAKFVGDKTAVDQQRLDYGASVSYSAFYLKSSGFFSDNLALNSNMSRTATANQPSVDLDNLPQ